MTKQYHFQEKGGEVIKKGKSNYPDFLRLSIEREWALRFALDILRELDHPQLSEPFISIRIFGKLSKETDD